LRRRNRREQRAVGLEVEQRRSVDAVEAAHQDDRAFNAEHEGDRRADRVRADRGAQRERAARGAVIRR
jgi:hypothetical protein